MNPTAGWKTDENDEGTSAINKAKSDRHHKFEPKLWTDLYKTKSTCTGVLVVANQSADLICKIIKGLEYTIYIDIDEEDDSRRKKKQFSKWSELPDLLLEKIFSYLSIREKYYASLVCKNWHRAFYLPYVWSKFVLEDTTLTRSRFNYYSGWQYVLDHLRTQMCLSRVGRNFRHLTFEPMLNFYNLYEFMNMVSWYTEQARTSELPEIAGVGCNIHTLKFTFPCNMTSRDDTERIRLFGTGGKLLAALKRLMGNLKKLKRLELIDLMLDPKEAQHLLDEVCEMCCLTLQSLILVNTTRVPFQVLHAGVFLNLQVLVISPQNLGDDTVELLGYTKLKHLHILQNRYTPNDENIKIATEKSWKVCRKNNSDLSVHLRIESLKEKTLIWQEGAPVKTILFDSPHIGINTNSIVTAIDFYRNDLQIYGHKGIPRFYQKKSFNDRNDQNLLLLCRECHKLHTLVVTERVSTATVLLLAYTAKNLRYLFVRGNAVIKRIDWPKNPEWSDEFYEWLTYNSRSYDLVQKEVSQIFGYNWKFLTDKEFKYLNVNMHNIYY